MDFKTLEELREFCGSNGLKIGFSENLEVFSEKKTLGKITLQNPMVILPMEGNDATEDGSPSGLTRRRYLRYAASGAALIWAEAIAVVREGRASPHQLYLTESNKENFRELTGQIKQECFIKNGFEPCLIAQLTHSGRYSKPEGVPKPVVAARSPLLDAKYNIPANYALVSDDELEKLEDSFVRGALLALESGFDGVDLKTSHGYLLGELLAGFTREGKYGGGYQGRARFIKSIVKKVRRSTPQDFLIACRISVYDSLPYPYGFGMAADGSNRPDFTEPVRLLHELKELGLDFAGVTMGNPYIYPHLTRPFRHGPYAPPEDPLFGCSRFFDYTAQVKKMVLDIPVVGACFSYLGPFAAQAAAYELEQGHIDLIGIGRQAFACPEFVRHVLDKKAMDPKRLCVACSKCTQIMRSGGPTGCVVRDAENYLPIYRQYCIESDYR